MEYKFVTDANNFRDEDFKSDLSLIETSEIFVWELHKSGRIIDLFDSVKKRNQKVKELVLIYKNSTQRFNKIQEEIILKYPLVESVNFKSHFEKIIILVNSLEELVQKQAQELNISDNLLSSSNRTKILNGSKKFDYESEFTSTVKEILNLINNNQIDQTSEQILPSTNIIDQVISEPIIPEKEEEEKDIILDNAIAEIGAKKIEFKPLDLHKGLEEESILKIPENKIKILEDKKDENIKIEEENIEVQKEEEPIQNNEPTKAELIKIIEKYFSYNDSPEIESSEKQNILKNLMESRSAFKYAQIIWDLEKEGKLDETLYIVNNIYGNTLSDLYNYEIGISQYSASKSWAIWDVAKQIYFTKHPSMTDSNKYKISNPLTDENKQNEILDRRVGWEIYSKMTTGELDKFLMNFKEPVYRKRMVDFMIEKPNKYNTLPSNKLAELGKNVRVGFACMKK